MKFYEEMKPLYLETDAWGVGLRAGLLQRREGMSCCGDNVSKSLLAAKKKNCAVT